MHVDNFQKGLQLNIRFHHNRHNFSQHLYIVQTKVNQQNVSSLMLTSVEDGKLTPMPNSYEGTYLLSKSLLHTNLDDVCRETIISVIVVDVIFGIH